MQRIHYAGDELLTGDDIADAMVDYAAALASRQTAATIEIPVLTATGEFARAHLLVGPASQLVTETTDSGYEELVDPELVAELRAATHRLSDTRPVVGAVGTADPADTGDDLEWPRMR